MASQSIWSLAKGLARGRLTRGTTKGSTAEGFTLIEVLVVLGLFGILFSIGLFLSMDSYRAYSYRSEREILVSLLDRARSQALANVAMQPHGICFDDGLYILFAGHDCVNNSASESIPASPGVTVQGLSKDTPVVFEQLTARVAPPPGLQEHQIIIGEFGRETIISITNEGRITW